MLRTSIEELDAKIWMLSNTNRELIVRAGDLEKKVAGEVWRKISTCEAILNNYLSSKGAVPSFNGKPFDVREVGARVRELGEEVREVRELLMNIASR
jgi:hypothetical protein